MANTPMNERKIAFFPMQSVQIGTDEAGNPIYDNAADAEILQKLRQREIKDGVYPDDSTYLQVMSNNNMTVTVKAGYAHVQGVQIWVKEDVTLPVEAAETLTNRVDRVVLRLSFVDRNVMLAIKKGDTSLIRDPGQTWELGLADLAVAMNNAVITQTEIIDLRLDTNACGVVSGLMQVDTATLFNQYTTWWKDQQNATGYLTVNNWLDKIYPVGCIYMSAASTNPATLFGGTWAAWGTGRVPVGVDSLQTEFNTVEKSGGHKDIQAHTHLVPALSGTAIAAGDHQHALCFNTSIAYDANAGSQFWGGGINKADIFSSPAGTHAHSITTNASNTGSSGNGTAGNLQPYITCYMWKRTA